MRFKLRSLFLLITLVALVVALVVSTQKSNLVLVDDGGSTWEVQRSVVTESKWVDKTKSPQLVVSEVYQIAAAICKHLDSGRERTGIGGWEPVSVTIERLLPVGENCWAYFIRLEGSDYPEHVGQSIVQEIVCMVLMDKTVVFDSMGCSTDKISPLMMTYPGIIDAEPKTYARPAREGGGFF